MKKFLALFLAVMMLLALVSCGTTTEVKTSESQAATQAQTAGTDKAADSNKLVMGTNASFPPYEFTDDEGEIVGIDAEIAAAIAERLGKELEIKDMEFDSLLTAVAGGSIDFVMAGLTVTDERKQQVNFSDTYATGVQVIIVPEGSEIKTVDDLEGKTIGVQSGTTGDIYCTDDYGEENVKQFANGALAVAALKNGQVDCVVIDNEPAKNFVKANTGLEILETEYAVEDYAIALAKESTDLFEDINGALKELKADGTIDEIIAKYIKAE
ncbi:MAG: transporter substrate-binding domain-containing protein [Clostridia bacterium]|nr:transporter substrate-binding domain-containing protein [Clostridia bacterium]